MRKIVIFYKGEKNETVFIKNKWREKHEKVD